VQFLTPAQWRRAVSLKTGTGKDASRSEAICRWPDAAAFFGRVRDEGRAEAVLIALAGLLLEKRP
jgi:crossover junction endodeoxyribonuclease RuvC